mgnify:CR=1 FL=1
MNGIVIKARQWINIDYIDIELYDKDIRYYYVIATKIKILSQGVSHILYYM